MDGRGSRGRALTVATVMATVRELQAPPRGFGLFRDDKQRGQVHTGRTCSGEEATTTDRRRMMTAAPSKAVARISHEHEAFLRQNA